MLTEAQASAFASGGALPLPQLFAFDAVAWLREAAIALAQREGVTRDGRRFAPRTITPKRASASSQRTRACWSRCGSLPAGR